MFRSRWIIAVAFGLIATLGQAQEQTQSPQGDTAAQQEPTQTFPIPLPVNIVSDEATAEARQSSEAEARQREIDALIAQQGMNAASQRMAFYSLLSAIFVSVGTVLLIWTLWLTRQANRSAQKAVNVNREIGQAQVRPWLLIEVELCGPLKVKDGSIKVVVECTVTNFGPTPAIGVTVKHLVTVETKEQHDFFTKNAQLSRNAKIQSPWTIYPGKEWVQRWVLTIPADKIESYRERLRTPKDHDEMPYIGIVAHYRSLLDGQGNIFGGPGKMTAFSAGIMRVLDEAPYRSGFPLVDGSYKEEELWLNPDLGQAPPPS